MTQAGSKSLDGTTSAPIKRERVQHLRKRILEAPYEICIERARFYTQSYKKTQGRQPAIRAANALKHLLKNMTLYILDEEAIVGNRSSKLVATVIPIERGDINVILELELNRLITRKDRPFHISPADREELEKEILPYWKDKSIRARKEKLWKENGLLIMPKITPASLRDRLRRFGAKSLMHQAAQTGGNPKIMATAGREIAANNPGLLMNVFDTQGHMVIGHRNVIERGLKDVKKQAQARLEQLNEESKTDSRRKAFLESVIICADAGRDFALRFAEKAQSMAETEPDPDRSEELSQIAERCRRVPYEPPRDFRDAVQFVWFIQLLSLLSYGIVAVFALGRIDQYLYPFYKRDIESGRISKEEALALVEELIVKLSYNLLVLPPYGKDTGSELGADNMAITIGGVGPDGKDATNDLTYLFLEATRSMRSMTNSVSIRISEKSPQKYLDMVVEIIRETNGPALFNDEAIIPAQQACGYSIEHARDYAIIGCVEPTSDGNTFGCTSGNDISLAGALEMTLNNGRLAMLGRRLGPETGDPKSFASFDELMQAYKKQVSASIDIIARCTNLKDQAYAEQLPCPMVSLTVQGCVENAADMTEGGAIYNFSSISGRGLATAADSLAAIKKFVYDERSMSMDQVLKMLANNFKGREKERQFMMTRAPKYGRDDDQADAIAGEIQEYFCREVMKYKNERGGIFRPSFFSYGMHVFEGQLLSATPNGRKAGEPISNSLSPSNNTESGGPAGVLKSAAKFDHRLIPNGCSVNIKMLPTLMDTREKRDKVGALLRSYFAMGGMHVQFNVIDNKTLIAAQKDPGKYKDLVVRVSGYSAYFVDLGKPVQDEIISRTEFSHLT